MNAGLESFRTVGVTDAAQVLGVHKETLRRWIRAGEFPAMKLGPRRVRILLKDLDAHLEECRTAQVGDQR